MKFLDSLKAHFLLWVWKYTPNCAEMSRLASRALEQPLPLGVRLRMRLHYLTCVWCRRFVRQLTFLHTAAQRFDHYAATPADHRLPAEAKLRILQRLQD